MTRVVVLASGSGSTLQALLDAFPGTGITDDGTVMSNGTEVSNGTKITSDVAVVAVICNTPGALVLERGRQAGIPALLIDHRGRSAEAFEAELAAGIDTYHPDLICLAGFLRILSVSFVRRYPGRMLNVHPALLPDFGGKGMYGERVHRAVLEAGVAVSGCTIHVVDETPDGGPIVAQRAVPVLPDDTPERLAARVQAEERRLYPEVIRWWAAGHVDLDGRRVIWRQEGSPSL